MFVRKVSYLNAAGPAGPPEASKFTTENARARAYGDTVILTGRVISERARSDGTSSRRAARYTDTYVRRNGQWQVASSHLGSNTDAPAHGKSETVPRD